MSEEFMNGAGGEQGNANGEPQGYVQPEHSQGNGSSRTSSMAE